MNNSNLLKKITEDSRPLFLVGFSGCGKSTLGAMIARKTKKNFIDLDNYISAKHNKSISQIFEHNDEQEFRALEKEALCEIVKLKNIIVATGGGTPCFFDNMTMMNKSGITVYLKLSPQKLFERLASNKNSRPLLAKKDDNELFEYIKKELQIREKYYSQSKFILYDV
jgi:shikimate kinase